MARSSKNLWPLSDADLIWLARDKVEGAVDLTEFEKHWIAQLADRFEQLVKEGK